MADDMDKEIKQYKGKKFGLAKLGKDVRIAIGNLEEQQAEIADKAQNKSLWAQIGSVVGGIGAVALGPVGWGATALYAGAGALAGGTVGAMGADAVKGKLGNMKKLEGSLKSKSKSSQAESVKAINKGIYNKIIKDSLQGAAFAGFTTGGGAALGEKLKGMGVSDKITGSKLFTEWGGAGKGNTMFGNTLNEGEVIKSSSVVRASGDGAVQDKFRMDGSPDIKQVGLELADPPGALNKTKTVASNVTASQSPVYTGTASQNNWLSSVTDTKAGKLVDTMNATGQDSSKIARGELFNTLNKKIGTSKTSFEMWMDNRRSLIS
jgi:hypothetical protein